MLPGPRDALHEQREACRLLAAELGARGTPSFFINGHVLTGAQPLSAFTARIGTELSAARALVALARRRVRIALARRVGERSRAAAAAN